MADGQARISSAFGRIAFMGYGSGGGREAQSSFVRVDAATDPELLWRLLSQTHGLTEPKLLISVTGVLTAAFPLHHISRACPPRWSEEAANEAAPGIRLQEGPH